MPNSRSSRGIRRKDKPSQLDVAAIREWIGLALGNVTVLTALLVYFGWRRNQAHAEELGLRESIAEQTTRDYVLKSVGPVIVAVLVVIVVGYAAFGLTRLLWRLRSRESPKAFKVVTSGILVAAALLPVLVVAIGILAWSASIIAIGFPFSLGLGALIIWYVRGMRKHRNRTRPSRGSQVLISALVVISLFWAVDRLAEAQGRSLGEALEGELPNRTQVVVYSPDRLYIDAPGALEERLPATEGKYRYRYHGLRLLDRTGERYFLVTDCWTREYGVVLMLPVETGLRYEFVRDNRSHPVNECKNRP